MIILDVTREKLEKISAFIVRVNNEGRINWTFV